MVRDFPRKVLAAVAAATLALSATAGMSSRANGVWLTDATNRPVVFVGPVKFNFAGNAKANVTGVSTNADGSLSLAFSVAGYPEVSLAATLRETGGKFTLDYALSGATNFNPRGAQGTLRLAKGMGKMGYPEKHGTWTRCAANPQEGEPFETYNVKLKRIGDARSAIWYVIDGDENWSGATFRNWIFHNEKKDKLRGLIFNSPEGPFALLWDRAEGFKLTDHVPKPRVKGAPFFHYEPWMRHWRVRNVREFKALGDEVTVIDPIGRRKTVKAVDGRVSLALDGEPVFVRGLDLSEFNDPSRHEAIPMPSDIEDIDRANRE